MPQDNEDKNENVTLTPSHWIVFTIDDGGEKSIISKLQFN